MPEFPPMQDVKQRIIDAIVDLYRDDHDLFHVDANERSISHKLAEHLQKRFPCWHVDCEYNRNGNIPKRLLPQLVEVPADDTKGQTVFPDIIIHLRGTNSNLLVIEMKKERRDSEEKDLEKLRAFTDPNEYNYRYGLFLRVGTRGCIAARFFDGNNEDEDLFLRQIQGALATLAVNEQVSLFPPITP